MQDIQTLSWQRLLSYRNRSIDLQSKLMDWCLHDMGLCHERIKMGFFYYFMSDLINSNLET